MKLEIHQTLQISYPIIVLHLTKWLSNSNIMSSLHQSELSPKCNSFNESIVERVLRIIWDINNDTLKLNLLTKKFSDTKRGVQFSIYCFFFIPSLLEIKLLIQDL